MRTETSALPIERPKWSRNRGWVRRLVWCWQMLADLVCAASAVALGTAVWAPLRIPGDGSMIWLGREGPTMLLLAVGTCSVVGLYRADARNPLERFRMRTAAALLYAFAAALLLLRSDPRAAAVVVPTSAALLLAFGVWSDAWLAGALDRCGAWRVRVALCGFDADSRLLASDLKAHPEWGFEPVGFLVPGESVAGAQCLGGDNPLLPVWAASRSVVGCFDLVAVPPGRDLPRDVDALRKMGVVNVLMISGTADLPTFGAQVRHLDGRIGIQVSLGRVPGRMTKRALDVALALPLGLLALPLVCVLAMAVKRADPGPAFYRQKRVGRTGRMIEVVKLRTMYRDAEDRLRRVLESDAAANAQWRTRFKLDRDPRILPGIGEFLRRSSLDELPQFWNVLVGEMSLVGPRPFPSYHMDAFSPAFRALRVSVPPGLTGVWQISARSDGDLEAQRAQDSFYICHRSLWLDLYVILATLPAVLAGRGAK